MKQRTGRKLRRTSSGPSHCTSLSPHRCQRCADLIVLLPLSAFAQLIVVFPQAHHASVSPAENIAAGGGGTQVHFSVKGVLLGALEIMTQKPSLRCRCPAC